jgi:hypothetical protein
MKKLSADNLFTLVGLVQKLDVANEIAEMFQTEELEGKDLEGLEDFAEQRGKTFVVSLINKVLQNLPSVKDEVNLILASVTGKTLEELSDISAIAYIKLFKEAIEFNKADFVDFFGSISS